ncbi:TPA: hypothetical protein N0F65_000955 [Lagenidium giganteum]|uniref:Inosine/uridine-preferring nucleoside hydrolase domain-containing protein n=1 Tax=Lagenidium giganteum TaxID=4803 RepID=A0AAV2YZD4_9STRA|nr:TPA: hypothetical protein N0F65_000955 [Lagenidium giganteum]
MSPDPGLTTCTRADSFLEQSCQEVLVEAAAVVERARDALPGIEAYDGCLDEIQRSIRDPRNEQAQREVMVCLEPNIDAIKAFYDVSKEIGTTSAMRDGCERAHKPGIQNDLSYFRRLVVINGGNNQLERFSDTPLSTLSLFVANHFPMLRVVINAVESALNKDPNAHCIVAQIANSCGVNLPSHRSRDPHLVVPTMRTLTGAILLYDHTSPEGAFRASKSDIKIKKCLKELAYLKASMTLSSTPSSSRVVISTIPPHPTSCARCWTNNWLVFPCNFTGRPDMALCDNNEEARVLIDTDAGVDDAVALIMALHGFPEDAVVGITTVFGNVGLAQANHNIAHVLQAIHRTDVPVVSGASRPIIAKVTEETWEGHGDDGLGGAAGRVDAALMTTATKNDAVHMLIEKAREHRGELIVVALGPLTNIALAILLDPSFVSSLKLLVFMGATARGEGNSTPHAEFNVGCDPEAAEIVLQHCTADKLYVMPFETTMDHTLPWKVFDDIFDDATCKNGSYIRRICQFYKNFEPSGAFGPCDAYAVAMLLHPQFITKSRTVRGRIHLTHDDMRGANIWEDVAKDNLKESTANATLVTEVDRNIFENLMRHAGVDDAVALIMALHGFPDTVVGITTVFGNVGLSQANHNVTHLLQVLDRTDVPVARGACRPIVAQVSEKRWDGHGVDGFGGISGTVDVTLESATMKNDAVQMLIQKAHEYRGELTVIALGPLTNVALAMLLDSSFVSSLKRLVIMGATARPGGNITPHAEFNIGCDPEAAEIVLQHCTADKLYIMPLETTRANCLTWNEFDDIFQNAQSTMGSFIYRMWQVSKKNAPSGTFTPCDAYAVAMLLHPAFITESRCVRGRIHLTKDEKRGASDWDDVKPDANKANGSGNATLVTGIDRDIFKQLLRRLVTE